MTWSVKPRQTLASADIRSGFEKSSISNASAWGHGRLLDRDCERFRWTAPDIGTTLIGTVKITPQRRTALDTHC